MIIPMLYDATPYPEGPRYFVRDWNLARSTLTPLRYNAKRFQGFAEPSDCFARPPGPAYRLRLFMPPAARAGSWTGDWLLRARHTAFPAICFSTLAPCGDYAFTPAAAVIEITLESLERELAQLGVASIGRNAS